jgi:hypothetical protein
MEKRDKIIFSTNFFPTKEMQNFQSRGLNFSFHSMHFLVAPRRPLLKAVVANRSACRPVHIPLTSSKDKDDTTASAAERGDVY